MEYTLVDLWNGRRRRLSLCSISFANQGDNLPWRWIVERTLAWLGNYRRLARDYEINPRTSEAWIKIAMIHLKVRTLA